MELKGWAVMTIVRGNIVYENGKITGILDAEEAMIGHNEYELMRIEKLAKKIMR